MCNPAANYWPGKAKRPGTDVELTSRDGTSFNVHVCRPDGPAPYPTVLVISDYFDPELYYYDLAEQYAAEGYLAVCPDFFHRQGKLAEQTHPLASARITDVSDQDVFDDVEATLHHLQAEGLVRDLAVTGFCWGGREAYLVAARHPEVKLLLPFYGYVVNFSGEDGNKPYSPLEEANRITARVVGSYGGGDDSIPVDQVEEMERKLGAAGRMAELKIYDGAPHCFFRTPEWEKESNDAWARALGALKETVG